MELRHKSLVVAIIGFVGALVVLTPRPREVPPSTPPGDTLTPPVSAVQKSSTTESGTIEAKEAISERLSMDDLKKWTVLREVLQSKNDNDPRLDTELKVLSEPLKEELRAKYSTLPAEDRSNRGTLVFLLGRNITTEKDLVFYDTVLTERPCLSMSDCSATNESDSHFDDTNELSQAYPQLMALKSLERLLKANSPLKAQARSLLEKAQSSEIPAVSRLATSILANAG